MKSNRFDSARINAKYRGGDIGGRVPTRRRRRVKDRKMKMPCRDYKMKRTWRRVKGTRGWLTALFTIFFQNRSWFLSSRAISSHFSSRESSVFTSYAYVYYFFFVLFALPPPRRLSWIFLVRKYVISYKNREELDRKRRMNCKYCTSAFYFRRWKFTSVRW